MYFFSVSLSRKSQKVQQKRQTENKKEKLKGKEVQPTKTNICNRIARKRQRK